MRDSEEKRAHSSEADSRNYCDVGEPVFTCMGEKVARQTYERQQIDSAAHERR